MIRVLIGNNTHLLRKKLRSLIADFTAESSSIEQFDAREMTDVDGLIDAVRSVSFLDPNKLVIVRDFMQNKELLDKIEYLVEHTADSTILLLYDTSADKRSKAYKYLKQHTDVQEFSQLQSYDLEKWIVNEAEKNGASIHAREAKYLITRLGENQQLLSKEIEKLAIAGGEIDEGRINSLTEQSPQSKVFDMLDALFQRQPDKAWRLYLDQRAQGEEPQKIIGMITWQLSQLTLAVFAPIKNKQTLIEAGMSPYSAQKVLSMARNISQQQINRYIDLLADIDMHSKTDADVESALETYFAHLAVD